MVFLTILESTKRNRPIFDPFETFKGYKITIVLKASEYKNLTIRFFLANKSFNFKEATAKYKEVFWIDSGAVDLLLATEDVVPEN